MEKKIFVTKPNLPNLSDFTACLESIWESRNLTNGGPYHQKLETELCRYLGVKYISLFNNGTIALLTALQALNIKGEVITTPYSFVATAHALLWNGIQPVFVDIDKQTLNIDTNKIQAAINYKTTAILPVHCYGGPCDVEKIGQIAKENNLKVIYDAAHAFGVRLGTSSILNYGDLSVLSFHATKVFNTFEGGAIVCNDESTKKRIDQLKNFGFVDEVTVVEAGINGKMSELNAAIGLLQLKTVDDNIGKRKSVDEYYRIKLKNIKGIHAHYENSSAKLNYSYFPIFVGHEYPLTRDQLYEKLKAKNFFARRYFYPLISSFPMYSGLPSANKRNLQVADGVAESVLCLPIFTDLTKSQIDQIVDIIEKV